MHHSTTYLTIRSIVRGAFYTVSVTAFIGWSAFGIWVLYALTTKP